MGLTLERGIEEINNRHVNREKEKDFNGLITRSHITMEEEEDWRFSRLRREGRRETPPSMGTLKALI